MTKYNYNPRIALMDVIAVIINICTILFICILISPPSNANEPETDDLRYMTEALYFESGVDSDLCKLYVAKAIITRVNKKFWGNTVEDVVHQVSDKGTCQFSYYCDGISEVMDYDSKTYKRSYAIANMALYNKDIPDDVFTADHFINHNLSDKTWHEEMVRVTKCGGHVFYESNMR